VIKPPIETEFGSFAEALRDSEAIARNPDAMQWFLNRYKFEIFFFCISMNDLGLTGGETAVIIDGPQVCDLCASNLMDGGFFIDGAIENGWANMCTGCFAKHGKGFGWGIGQFYRVQVAPDGKSHRWVCIAGGNNYPE
jgi:hypothetical protein